MLQPLPPELDRRGELLQRQPVHLPEGDGPAAPLWWFGTYMGVVGRLVVVFIIRMDIYVYVYIYISIV